MKHFFNDLFACVCVCVCVPQYYSCLLDYYSSIIVIVEFPSVGGW